MSQSKIEVLEGQGAYRATWSETCEGGVSQFTLYAFKGNRELSLRIAPAQGDGETVAVADPAQYGMTRPPEGLAEFMAVAHRFVSARP